MTISEIAARLQGESEHEYLLERIAETFERGLLAAEIDSTIFWCNPTMAELLGHSVSSLVGQNLDIFLDADRKEWHRRQVRGVGERLDDILTRSVEALHREGHKVKLFISVRGTVYQDRRIVVAVIQKPFAALPVEVG